MKTINAIMLASMVFTFEILVAIQMGYTLCQDAEDKRIEREDQKRAELRARYSTTD